MSDDEADAAFRASVLEAWGLLLAQPFAARLRWARVVLAVLGVTLP